MKEEDIEIVRGILYEKGDSFWKENTGLFYDIVNILNESGYDLKLKIDLSKVG